MNGYLLKKDMLLVRKRFAVMFIMGLLIFIGIEYQVRESLIRWMPMSMLSGLFSYMLVGMVFEKEERNQASCLLLSAAYSRKDIMRNRFMFIVGLSVAFLLCCAVLGGVIYGWGMDDLWISCGLGLTSSAVPLAVMVPVLARFEYVKAQNVIMTVFFALVILFVLGIRFAEGFQKILESMHRISTGIGFVVILLICAGLLTLSGWISVRMFDQREFY